MRPGEEVEQAAGPMRSPDSQLSSMNRLIDEVLVRLRLT
jgi:hypothetical protein